MKENEPCGCYLREKVTFGQEVRKSAPRLSGVKNAKTQSQLAVPWRSGKWASVAIALFRGTGCGRKGFQRDGWGWAMQYFLLHGGKWKTFERLSTEEWHDVTYVLKGLLWLLCGGQTVGGQGQNEYFPN